MLLRPLLPDHRSLALDEVRLTANGITVLVASMSPNNQCPLCGQPSTRVHSRYRRKLTDLPWQGLAVCICWRSRKFFYDNPACPQRVFTERLPDVARPYARKTCRLAVVLTALGFACGGEGGARLAERLAMSTSPDSLLRAIRQAILPDVHAPRVVGVDDWAFRRGQRYGTILCDLEQHRRIDLLPDRSAETLETWLKAHPSVEIVSRDRGDYYIKGATAGAPQAIQVTDRWHLLKNLREALARAVDHHSQQVHAAARAVAASLETTSAIPVDQVSGKDGDFGTAKSIRPDSLSEERRVRRWQRYQRVMELHAQNISGRKIARQLGMDRGAVRRMLAANGFPERAQRPYRRRSDPYVDYLRQRWQEGCHNAAQLTKELKAKGFKGSYYAIRRRVAHWRDHYLGRCSSCTPLSKPPPSIIERPSSKRIAWLLLKPPQELTPEEQVFVKSLGEHCPTLENASVLSREFVAMVRDRRIDAFDNWMARACACKEIVELRRFANGLANDLSAVKAALSLPWSNGQTEGQVNRLKLIKRQMFGRAKFDLLRQRVLCTC